MYKTAIIGAGVVGAMAARRLSSYDMDLVILEKEERETLRKLIQETVREELKSGGMERMPACEKEEIPGQMLDFLFQMEQE